MSPRDSMSASSWRIKFADAQLALRAACGLIAMRGDVAIFVLSCPGDDPGIHLAFLTIDVAAWSPGIWHQDGASHLWPGNDGVSER